MFDEGVGFRYEFPEQENLKHFVVSDELTQYNLTGDHKAFWIPGDFDTNEYFYSTSLLSEINSLVGRRVADIFPKWELGENFVQTPIMMKSSSGIYINIFEAAQ